MTLLSSVLGGMAFGFTARVGQLAIQKRNIYDSASLTLTLPLSAVVCTM